VQANAREFPGQYQLNLIWAQFWMWQLPVPKPPGQPGGQWRFAFRHRPRMIFSAPAVSAETLYVGDLNGYLYARDALNGSERWQFQAEGGIETSPLILGSRVYFGTAEGMLYALDRAQGALGWKLALGGPVQAAPVFANGRLYIRTRDGRFHAIE
jgi:outer membrane protein assembly factor BamB